MKLDGMDFKENYQRACKAAQVTCAEILVTQKQVYTEMGFDVEAILAAPYDDLTDPDIP